MRINCSTSLRLIFNLHFLPMLGTLSQKRERVESRGGSGNKANTLVLVPNKSPKPGFRLVFLIATLEGVKPRNPKWSPGLNCKGGCYTFLFKQMLLSKAAPGRGGEGDAQSGVPCLAYSEVTISKNSFLKNLSSGLGSTQVKCGAQKGSVLLQQNPAGWGWDKNASQEHQKRS